MHKLLNIAEKILFFFLSVVLLFNSYLIVMKVIFNNELPKFFGMTQIVIISGSMEPAIKVGDMLVIREQKDYRVNDIVSYRSDSSLITHRVISVDGNSLLTKGDGNNVEDPPIILSQVEGKMLVRIPKLGYVTLFLKTQIGIMITVLAGFILISVFFIADRFKKSKHD